MTYRVVGIDPSLTSTGIAYTSGPGIVPALYRVRSKLRGHARLASILGAVEAYAEGADLAVIESPLLYAGKGDVPLDLAGLTWMIRHQLWGMGIPYAMVSPPLRCQFITGNGNAAKDAVLAAAIHRFACPGLAGNDEADALVYAAMGCEWLGEPIVELPAAQRAIVRAVHTTKGKRGQPKILWPPLGARDVQAVLA